MDANEQRLVPASAERFATFCVDKVTTHRLQGCRQASPLHCPSAARSCPAAPPAPAPMHQRELTVAIKRARQIALLPYVAD